MNISPFICTALAITGVIVGGFALGAIVVVVYVVL